MKKLLIYIAFFTGLAGYAQDFKIGFELAPSFNSNKNFIKENGKWVETDKSGKTGWKGGLVVDYGFAENYFIHSGLLIHTRDLSGDDFTQKLTTLEIPLALKLHSNEVTDNIHITGIFGASIDVNVDAQVKVAGEKVKNKEDFKTLGASFIFGPGVAYDLDFGTIELGFTYALGLTDVAKSDVIKTKPKHLAVDVIFYF
jgi:hypothetical protein